MRRRRDQRLLAVGSALALTVLTLAGCVRTGPIVGSPGSIRLSSAAVRASLAADQQRFAGRLLAALPGGNALVSPFSVASALDLLYAGAAGSTATGMAQALSLAGLGPGQVASAAAGLGAELAALEGGPHPVLSVANALWAQRGLALRQPFERAAASGFGAAVRRVAFTDPLAAALAIDAWVARRTRDRIEHLLSPSELTQAMLVVVNAIDAKDRWADPALFAAPSPGTFQLADGDRLRVPMLATTGYLGYRAAPGYQEVALPLADGRLTLTLVLPSGPVGALDGLLTDQGVAPLLGGLRRTAVRLLLPDLRLTQASSLNQVLSALGMSVAFGRGADFSGVTAEPLQLALVVTKTFLDINRYGVEAAGATASVLVSVSLSSGPPHPRSVVANRPFLLLLTDRRSGAVLFEARVSRPD